MSDGIRCVRVPSLHEECGPIRREHRRHARPSARSISLGLTVCSRAQLVGQYGLNAAALWTIGGENPRSGRESGLRSPLPRLKRLSPSLSRGGGLRPGDIRCRRGDVQRCAGTRCARDGGIQPTGSEEQALRVAAMDRMVPWRSRPCCPRQDGSADRAGDRGIAASQSPAPVRRGCSQRESQDEKGLFGCPDSGPGLCGQPKRSRR